MTNMHYLLGLRDRGKIMNFSGLIPVYVKENPENFTYALNSIIKQTLKPSEIVIVKDGPLSSELDNVIELFAKSYDNFFKIVPLDRNVGVGIALQLGVLNCSNEIIARMDSDDIASPFKFEKQISFLEENEDIDIVGSWIGKIVNSSDEEIKEVSFVTGCAMLVKNNVFKEIGLFDEGYFFYNEDVDFCLRTLRARFKIFHIPSAKV
jgi:GT2 family glycosyltransferase